MLPIPSNLRMEVLVSDLQIFNRFILPRFPRGKVHKGPVDSIVPGRDKLPAAMAGSMEAVGTYPIMSTNFIHKKRKRPHNTGAAHFRIVKPSFLPSLDVLMILRNPFIATLTKAKQSRLA